MRKVVIEEEFQSYLSAIKTDACADPLNIVVHIFQSYLSAIKTTILQKAQNEENEDFNPTLVRLKLPTTFVFVAEKPLFQSYLSAIKTRDSMR